MCVPFVSDSLRFSFSSSVMLRLAVWPTQESGGVDVVATGASEADSQQYIPLWILHDFILFFSKIITYVYLNPTRNLNQNQTTAVSTEELFIVLVSIILLTWVSVFQALLEGESGRHEARHGVWGTGGVQEQRVGAAVQDDVSEDVDERLLTHDQEDLWQEEQRHDTAHPWSTLLMQ